MTYQSSLEMWLVLQAALEAVLVLLMVVFLVRLRRLSGPRGREAEEARAAAERFLEESEKLSKAFTENLKQKKELSVGLLLKLEHKIQAMNDLLKRAEENLSQAERAHGATPPEEQANPAAPESRALVIRLAERGLSIEEIAREARLHRGEVELILDLEKQFGT
ncbi:MAG: hypothetical protein KKB20_09020 [Proteobacteria bacterium]|nr:hypothetical protein [Pseudomonadota bacterium]